MMRTPNDSKTINGSPLRMPKTGNPILSSAKSIRANPIIQIASLLRVKTNFGLGTILCYCVVNEWWVVMGHPKKCPVLLRIIVSWTMLGSIQLTELSARWTRFK